MHGVNKHRTRAAVHLPIFSSRHSPPTDDHGQEIRNSEAAAAAFHEEERGPFKRNKSFLTPSSFLTVTNQNYKPLGVHVCRTHRKSRKRSRKWLKNSIRIWIDKLLMLCFHKHVKQYDVSKECVNQLSRFEVLVQKQAWPKPKNTLRIAATPRSRQLSARRFAEMAPWRCPMGNHTFTSGQPVDHLSIWALLRLSHWQKPPTGATRLGNWGNTYRIRFPSLLGQLWYAMFV